MSKELSIIVPVYNVLDYLNECLDSVLRQDEELEYELILVDDGSTDGSSELCENYAKQYEQIEVIHQANRGLSAARNSGISASHGEYIIFLDADDVWNSNMFSVIKKIIKYLPDMGTFSMEKFYEDSNRKCEPIKQAVIPKGESGNDFLNEVFDAGYMFEPYAWLYIYNREFLIANDLKFIDGQASSEDFEFNIQALKLAKNIIGIDEITYRYRQRDSSLTDDFTYEKYIENVRSKVRAYRNFSNPVMANYYVWNILQMGRLNLNSEQFECVKSIYDHNRDILDKIDSVKYRFFSCLISAFGLYSAGKTYCKMHKVSNYIKNFRQ